MVKKRYLRDVTLQCCNFEMAKLDVFDLFSQSSQLFFQTIVMYIPSYSQLCTCVYLFLVSPVAIFRRGFSFVEYCPESFPSFLQSDY